MPMKINTPHAFKVGKTEVISDDWLAQMIMLQLGIWEYFTEEVASSIDLTMGVAENHPTHWCLCSRHRNDLNPYKNCFQILAFPKDSVEAFTVHAIMKQHLEGEGDIGIDIVEPKPE
jgi:hypothetical protein